MRLFLTFTALLLLGSCTPQRNVPAPPLPPSVPAEPSQPRGQASILMLGDSQISFGAGQAYQRFFSNLGAACASLPIRYGKAQAAAIGVRSTALHHWSTTQADARGALCDVDEKFGVNAGSYGVTSPTLSYVQIGADPVYPFCPAGRSALQAVFETPRFDADLVILSFLGNAVARWQSPATANSDWAAAQAQVPAGTACLVMTTIPSFEAGENARRMIAQENLARAVEQSGRCAFVAGFTPATLAEFEGNKSHFRTDDAGEVTDPRHPTSSSAERFVALQTPALCAAVARAVQN